MKLLPLAFLMIGAVPLQAQVTAPRPAPVERPAPQPGPPRTAPRRILFIGNSFTQGAFSPVRNWRAHTVTDLNGAGFGGVPALFKHFTAAVGLSYDVSLETAGGRSLGFHYDERRQLFDRAWDVVVLQEYSTLDPDRPGDPTNYLRDVGRLATLFRARNPAVRLELMATWSRPDVVYRPGSPWSNTPITRMATDLRTAADRARAATPGVAGVLPVGEAWNRAITVRLADPNPYDGIAAGQVNLWAWDHYHASALGYYLEALIVFGQITGRDPRMLGRDEAAASELGIDPAVAGALQQIAWEELQASGRR
ncbi:hypothetical protein SAMN06297144_1782 [Sphingomonas guangdongensis]|uniref:PEP-CTERM protein-sorting domain-containing protein n=1 Tax=Sphingomonas guangdongensis TaxID=1141890 RepID=A0A285QYP7_9SPHN|nr:PEP-CTERM sorting domain-containing protein [Sphingomonas guangdongensis]SOB86674.1 hypothetical protein SAMN06297144_1782 [Sphingomonas guangdongensis]